MKALERHVSPEQIAELLDVHPRTVLRWIAAGRICRARKLGGKLIRVPESAVQAFLASNPAA